MTKIAIVTEIIAPYRIPVFNALAQRPEIKLDVTFLSENDPTLREWRVYKDEIKFSHEVLPSWRQRFGAHNILLNRGVRRSLKRLDPDVVLCGGYNYLASWQAADWARANKKHFILWSESTAFDKRHRFPATEFMKRRFLRLCDAFVVPGQSSRDYLKQLGIPESEIHTALNAIDTDFFSAQACKARHHEAEFRVRYALPPRYFLYVGRLVESKGVFDLLSAYEQLSASTGDEVSLVFAGTGVAQPELETRARQLPHGSVRFLNFVHREELPAIYALADALVLPTHSDPWGLVVNEAMACSLPVVVTSVAGCAADLVSDGQNGFVIPPHDVAALFRSLLSLISDLSLRKKMGCRSRERVELFSPANWAQGILDTLSFLHPK